MPSDANRDAGVFLVFLGVVGAVPLHHLYRAFILGTVEGDWRKGAFLGSLLVLWGLWLILFTRKTFRVLPGAVVIHEGFLRPPSRYAWRGEPRIRLRPVEMERAGKVVEMWQVNLVDGRYEYCLDRRAGQQLESRTLAERLAKAIGCPVIENRADGDLEIPFQELDLPFCQRVRRHPRLLGPRLEKPAGSSIREQREGEARIYSWNLVHPALITELAIFFLVVLAVGLVPLPISEAGHDDSLLDLAIREHDYLYFTVVGGLFVLALFLLFGYRVFVRIGPEGVRTQSRLWGVPLHTWTLRTQDLEEVSVRQTGRGSFLQLISDEQIVSLRMSNPANAAWLASQMRHYFAEC